ncbi:hypothetical protein AKO1_014117, partial [Acrasis kona]
ALALPSERFADELNEHVENFYAKNDKLREKLLTNSKQLYDLAKSIEIDVTKGKGLKQLFVKGFDDEQIWTQLQKHHEPLLKGLEQRINQIPQDDDLLKPEYLEDLDDEKDDDDDDDDEQEGELDERALRRAMANEEDESDDDDDDAESMNNPSNLNEEDMEKKNHRQLPEDLNEFLDHLEDKLDDIDEFEYQDEDRQDPYSKEDARALAELYGDDYDDEEEEEDEYDQPDEGPKTLFEQQQAQMLSEIEELEEKNVAEKEWQQTGEVASMKRPKNSLLDSDLDFEHTTASKPIITEQITQDLESIIINRIVTRVFDDVEKPTLEDDKQNLQNQAELKHEKGKKSLAQVYEEMYLKKVEGKDVEEEETNGDPKILATKQSVKKLVAEALYKLNIMSSFNYVAPPTVAPETETSQQSESILTQETLPAQEVMSGIKWLPQGDVEQDSEDRKRKRRSIKAISKKKFKGAEELIDTIQPGSKTQRDRLSKDIEESKGIDVDQRGFSSSKKFFQIINDNLQKHGAKKQEKPKKDQDTSKAYKMR